MWWPVPKLPRNVSPSQLCRRIRNVPPRQIQSDIVLLECWTMELSDTSRKRHHRWRHGFSSATRYLLLMPARKKGLILNRYPEYLEQAIQNMVVSISLRGVVILAHTKRGSSRQVMTGLAWGQNRFKTGTSLPSFSEPTHLSYFVRPKVITNLLARHTVSAERH